MIIRKTFTELLDELRKLNRKLIEEATLGDYDENTISYRLCLGLSEHLGFNQGVEDFRGIELINDYFTLSKKDKYYVVFDAYKFRGRRVESTYGDILGLVIFEFPNHVMIPAFFSWEAKKFPNFELDLNQLRRELKGNPRLKYLFYNLDRDEEYFTIINPWFLLAVNNQSIPFCRTSFKNCVNIFSYGHDFPSYFVKSILTGNDLYYSFNPNVLESFSEKIEKFEQRKGRKFYILGSIGEGVYPERALEVIRRLKEEFELIKLNDEDKGPNINKDVDKGPDFDF